MVTGKATCRLCDRQSSTGINIFGERGIKLNIQPIIRQHFTIDFKRDDGVSDFICQKCWRTINNFHQLYCNVKKNSETLISATEKNEIKNEKTSFIEETSCLEYVAVNEDLRNEVEPQPEFQITDDDVIDYDHTQDLLDRNYNQPVKMKRNFESNDIKVESVDMKTTNRLKFTEQNKQISDFIGIQCDICFHTMETFTELKKHFISKHGITGYLRCCKRKYFRQNRLYLHILNHRAPNQYKCDKCDKSFIDNVCLREHKKIHDPSRKKLPCPHCAKQFEYKSLLDKHIGIHVDVDTGTPYTCDICGKCFRTRTAIAAHLFNMHRDKGRHICDVCARVFRSRKKLDDHQINHMGIVQPRVQCKICGVWQSNKYFRHHMRRHVHNEQECTICGKSFANRDCLNNHRSRVHGKSRQCPVCDKVFVTKKGISEHMSTHTGKPLYKCPYCTMEFKSSANMYKHRQRLHPIEWEQDRGKYINTRINSQCADKYK